MLRGITKVKKYFTIVYSNKNYKIDQQNITTPDFKLSDTVETAKKQIYWRIRNIGQRELEMLIMSWYDTNKDNLSVNQLQEFNNEILNMDIPEMNKYFVKLEPLLPELKFSKLIMDYSKTVQINNLRI